MREPISSLQTEPFITERSWAADDLPVLTALISLPQPVDCTTALARRIRRYYHTQEKAFLHYCQHALLPLAQAEYQAALAASSPLPLFRAELTYQTTWNENGLWSLYTESREQLGRLPALRIRRSDTWDLNTGYPIPLPTLFLPKTCWKQALLHTAAAEIERQERCGIARYHPHWRQLLRCCFHSKCFYLSHEGLCYFYPMYTIAPSAEGIPTFTLPWGTPHLKDLQTPSDT